MKIALYVAGVLALLVLIIVVIGSSLPESHTASREVTVPASPDRVFALIATPADYARWRPDVDSVEVLPPEGGKERFREHGSNGALLMRIDERAPGSRFVTAIADSTLPFGGRWSYDLTPSGTGTRLRITEDGKVYNPIFRFVSRFVFGHTATMDAYLAAVEKELRGNTASPGR